MKRQHKHAEMIRRWLDDDSLIVEAKSPKLDTWLKVNDPSWFEDYEYRFKPKMIKCGDMEFPEPMRVAPALGFEYWYINLIGFDRTVAVATWHGGAHEWQTLKLGLLHATQEAAEAHALALIAVTEKKE